MTQARGEGWELRRAEALAELGTLANDVVDLVLTDPPYSSGGAFRGDRAGYDSRKKYVTSSAKHHLPAFTGDNRDQRSYGYWTALWAGEALRVAKPAGHLLVFTDWRQLPTTTDAVQAGGWVWRGVVPWDKVHGRPRVNGFRLQCEYLVWATKGPLPGKPTPESVYLPGTFSVSVPRSERLHVAPKPVELLRRLCALAPDGGVVLDPFAGSGSTLVAAVEEGRRAFGFELDDHYFQVAAERLRGLSCTSTS